MKEQNPRINLLKKYLEEDPADCFSKYALALEFIKSGNDSEALIYMDDLNKNYPHYLPNYYHFGKILERTGQAERAKLIYHQGTEIALSQGDHHTRSELMAALESME